MPQDLIIKLKEFGFSEKEAMVYLVALELGNVIASTVTKKTGINRTTVYTILENLKTKGYVCEIIKNNTKYYSAVSPDLLLKELEKKTDTFKDVLPALLSLTSKYDNKPKVEYYEGYEGIKNMFEIVLAEGYEMDEPYLSFVGKNTNKNKQLEKYLEEEFIPKRASCPARTKIIASSKNDEKYLNENISLNEKILINEELFDLGDEIVLYGKQKVAIFIFGDDNIGGIIVNSKSLFDGLKSIFNLIWKIYEKHD